MIKRQRAYILVTFYFQGLQKRGFHLSKHNLSVYVRQYCILLVYVDDIFLFAKDNHKINNPHISLTQPHIIDCIIDNIPSMDKANPENIPADPNSILNQNLERAARKEA